MQDLSRHPGQVHPAPRSVHRRDHGVLLRRAQPLRRGARHHHPVVQPHRHRRQLRRRVVRHPREHVRELARGLRQPPRQAVPDLRDSAARRHEHRDAADQRRAVHDAVHSAVHPRPAGRPVLHRVRDRRIARGGRASHCRRHLHQDCRHRIGSDEDRLQHQGRRCAQSGRDRRLHGRQRGRLGRPERRRVRDLRRHRRRAHHVHSRSRPRAARAGAAAGLDFRDAHHDDRRERSVVLRQRSHRQRTLRECRPDELRGAADVARVADVGHLGGDYLCRVVCAGLRSG